MVRERSTVQSCPAAPAKPLSRKSVLLSLPVLASMRIAGLCGPAPLSEQYPLFDRTRTRRQHGRRRRWHAPVDSAQRRPAPCRGRRPLRRYRPHCAGHDGLSRIDACHRPADAQPEIAQQADLYPQPAPSPKGTSKRHSFWWSFRTSSQPLIGQHPASRMSLAVLRKFPSGANRKRMRIGRIFLTVLR